MIKTMSVTDLKDYDSVLENVSEESSVLLTKDGKESYVISDYENYHKALKAQAALRLFTELEKGRLSAEEQGWKTKSDVIDFFKSKGIDL